MNPDSIKYAQTLFYEIIPDKDFYFKTFGRLFMLPLILENQGGFCWTREYFTIGEPRRIYLPAVIRKELEENNVIKLWRFNAFGFKGIVLCPYQSKLLYEQRINNNLKDKKDEELYRRDMRRYYYPDGWTHTDAQGRILLTEALIKHANIKYDNEMIIIGTGMWYEIWHVEDYDQ